MNRLRSACHPLSLLLLGGLLASSEVPGLVDATLMVTPSQVVASGLQKVHGVAIVRVTTDRDYLGRVRYQPEDPLVLWRPLRPQFRCLDTNLYKLWPYLCAPPHPNRSVVCQFDGIISNCQPGSGGSGEPPPFEAEIVHVDLDVDSDNDSDPLVAQKRPIRTDAEDEVEFPREPELPGLVLITNRGFEEDGYGNGSAPVEDRRKDGINTTDQDLSQGKLEIRGRKSGYADLTYPEQLYRIYRSSGSSWVWWRSGERIRLSPGLYPVLLEGIDPGMGTTVVTFTPDDLSSGGQPAIDKQRITVVDMVLQVDRDRDGTVSEDPTDLTWTTQRLRFWANNDRDGEQEDMAPSTPDFARNSWNAARLRDIEDLSRMRLVVRGIDDHLRSGRMSVAVRWDSDDGIEVKSFRYHDPALTDAYLQDAGVGTAFCGSTRLVAHARGDRQEEVPVNTNGLVPGYGGYHSPWLWHANIPSAQRPGSGGRQHRGRLGVVVRQGRGAQARPIAWYRHLHLAISDARRWYEHETCGDFATVKFNDQPHAPRQPQDGDYKYQTSEPGLWAVTEDQYNNSVLDNTADKVLVFIHGYRLQPWERRAFAETMLKRLYWQSFGGRMVLLSWPTEYVGVPWGQLGSPANYDRSEMIARLTGRQLAVSGWLAEQQGRFPDGPSLPNLTIACHSMGNIVLSSGVRALGPDGGVSVAGSYLSMQSADVAAAYDPEVGPLTPPDDLPPGPLGGTIGGINDNAFLQVLAPDIYRFDVPRTWRPVPTGGLGSPEPTGTQALATGLGLQSPRDGMHYARGMQAAFDSRVNLFNPNDIATAASWYVNAYYRISSAVGEGDTGYGFRRIPNPATPSQFRDQWLALRNDSNVPSWINHGPWIGIGAGFFRRSYRELSWQPESTDLERWTERSAILSMITTPRSRSVGADRAGVEHAFSTTWNGSLDGMSNDEKHHSYQFNLTIQRTRAVYERILGTLQ